MTAETTVETHGVRAAAIRLVTGDMFYRVTTLENGVTVLTESIDSVRSVALGIWFSVGSRDEYSAEAGMSHFMEHMMFKGTPTRSAAQISETFDRIGAELNAFTSKEYTCYYSRVIDEHLPTAIEVLGDMVGHASLSDESCEKEREVVIEEIARMEDTPDDRIHELFAQTLWPDHPIGLPILGSRTSVASFDHAVSSAFHTHHYLTGNCIVAAAGNIDHDALVRLVQKHVLLPAGSRSARAGAHAPKSGRRIAVLTKETEQAHIAYGVSGLNARHPDRFALAVADTAFGGGMSSRLFQEIREKLGLAYSVYSFHALYQDTGQWTMYAGTRPDNAGKVIGLIQSEVDRLLESGLTADELSRSKESIKGTLLLGLESTRNRMTRLGKNAVTDGELLSVDEIVAHIDAVDLEAAHRVARELFSGDHALALIGPYSEDEVAYLAERAEETMGA
ncbi:MAG: pitrilysin family protein [Coriobacteriia bacterium]|nr:pitrilysin family protein [Coriobacteriia bacterium]